MIKDFTGDIGIPGVSNFWTDKSPSAMGGDGEAEFNKASYAHAIEQLPVTLAKVERLENIREENRVLEQSIEERLNRVLALMRGQQDVIDYFVGIKQSGEQKTPCQDRGVNI